MATNPRSISINDLLLDTHNPRVEPVGAQREEMQKLLDDQKENIAFLAEDIVANGISPIDLALVTCPSVLLSHLPIVGAPRLRPAPPW